MLAARAGNQGAFGDLVEAHATTTFRLCYAILRSPAEAEDAAQDAFVRAWRDLPKLRDAGSWQAWLRKIAVRTAIDRARSNRRFLAMRSEVRPVDDPAEAYGTRDEIGRAFMRLAADDRALLVLRFYVDLEVPDIAISMGIPLGTAKSRLHRALGRLRQVLETET